jgi:hypothetical protein
MTDALRCFGLTLRFEWSGILPPGIDNSAGEGLRAETSFAL